MAVSPAEDTAIAPLICMITAYIIILQETYCYSIDGKPGNMQDNAVTVRYILNGANFGP